MKISIIADDNAVYIDGVLAEVDLSWLCPNIHAVQWDGTSGEVEFRCYDEKSLKGNEVIESFEMFQRAVKLHEIFTKSLSNAEDKSALPSTSFLELGNDELNSPTLHKGTPPEVKIGSVANIFSRLMHFVNVGDKEFGHKHSFDHLTLLAHGSLRVTVDGKSTDFKAPHQIYIRADKLHELEALEANTVASCIHVLRDGEEIITPDMMPTGVELRRVKAELVKMN